MQISDLLNSSMDELHQIIPQLLSIVGYSFQVDGLIFCQIHEGKEKGVHYWAINEQILTELKEVFTSQAGENLLDFSNLNQVTQVCHYHEITNNVPNISASAKRAIESFFPCCVLSVPLRMGAKFFGNLIIHTKQHTRSFFSEEVQTLEIIAKQLVVAVQHIQLQERLSYLEAENQRLQAACQNKSDYLSHMNHELRTPLSGILGFSKMLREELYGSLNDKQKQYVNGIAVSGKHLLALVNDFLDLSKIEAEREEVFLETIAVEDICLSAIAIVEAKAKEQGLALIIDIGENVDFCTVDQRRIKQILLNLLSNAIKFTEKGSITLQVKSSPEFLTFCVIDTGIGITKADQQKLFQPFQQIQSHLSRRHKGTGLGLTLSRKLAQLHGGDLTLTSEIGKGSCFTLQLPINLENRESGIGSQESGVRSRENQAL